MKQQLHHLLTLPNYEAIVHLAGQNRRVLSFLTALTYHPNRLTSWRAIEALGLAANRIANDNPEYVRVHLRRMQWLLNDESGGIGWRLPEAMGEIIRHRPHDLAEFIPIVISLFDMEEEDVAKFRPGILWATGRLAQAIPSPLYTEALRWVEPCLTMTDPATRGMAVWCLGQLRAVDLLSTHPALFSDESTCELYANGSLIRQRIADLARAAGVHP